MGTWWGRWWEREKPAHQESRLFGGHRAGAGGAGAELSGPRSLPWMTVFPQAGPPPRPTFSPLLSQNLTPPRPSVSSVAAGNPGGTGRGGAAGGPAAGPAEGAHRLPPGPAATLGQRGRCRPGVPEVPGGPRAGLDPTLRGLCPSGTSCSGLVPSRYLITNNSCSSQWLAVIESPWAQALTPFCNILHSASRKRPELRFFLG